MLFVTQPLSGSVLIDWASILLLIYLYLSVRSYYRLSHIPGPRLWGWTLFPLLRAHTAGVIFDKFGDLHDQYGPLVRVAPKTLITSDPDVLRRINSARSPYVRAPWYIAVRLIPGQDNVLSQRDEAKHDELRRKMAMGYSGKENVTLEDDINGCVRDLITLLETRYTSRTAGVEPIKMDLAQKLQFFTSDIMSKLAFDAKFNDLRDNNDNYGYVNEIETVFPGIFWMTIIPSFVAFMTRTGVLSLVSPENSSKLGFGKILAICKAQVAKRFDADGKLVGRKDMLGSFLRNGLSRKEAEQEAVLQLAAGSDTTATGLRSTIKGLLQNPRARAKLVAEIEAAIAAGLISADGDDIVSDEQARKLPYLQACIKEGLRRLPPIAGMLPKQTPPGGDTLCGYFVPEGVSIAYSAKATHHSKILYAPDETAFRPDRWIHTSGGGDEPSWDKLKAMDRNNELIFGYGKYLCLGKSVALIELNKVVLELVKRFDMTILNPDKPMDTSCYGIHIQKNFWVTVRKRSSVDGNEEKTV